VQSHLIITNHLVQTGAMIINKPVFERLSRSDQTCGQGGDEACDWANAKMKGANWRCSSICREKACRW